MTENSQQSVEDRLASQKVLPSAGGVTGGRVDDGIEDNVGACCDRSTAPYCQDVGQARGSHTENWAAGTTGSLQEEECRHGNWLTVGEETVQEATKV